jgi:ribosomal protein L37AE/L43A
VDDNTERYLEAGCKVCPKCESEDLRDYGTHIVGCNACRAKWKEHTTVNRITMIREGSTPSTEQ